MLGRYGAKATIAESNFHSRSVFSENLVAIEMRKLEVKFNKPVYMGICILDISKTYLYEFHHDYISSMYRKKCKVMYADTDSLIYHWVWLCVWNHEARISKYDTSDYAIDNAHGIPFANKKYRAWWKTKTMMWLWSNSSNLEQRSACESMARMT